MIFYFSATGNCKYVASRVAAEIEEETVAISDCMKKQQYVFDIKDGEKIGFVLPTYFWGLPAIVCEFLKMLEIPAAGSGHHYVYNILTYGTSAGPTGYLVDDLLKRTGLSLGGCFRVRMPDTWTPIFDLTDKEKIRRINAEAEKQIDEIIDQIKQETRSDFYFGKKPMLAVRVARMLYESNRKTKYFTFEDNCTGCGLCAKKCPVGAIELHESKPVWIKEKCTLCLGCLHRCPEFAIQYGKNTRRHGQYVNPNVRI